MTAAEIIEELNHLPMEERVKVKVYLEGIRDDEIPESFWQGLREADQGKAMELREEHFDSPPA